MGAAPGAAGAVGEAVPRAVEQGQRVLLIPNNLGFLAQNTPVPAPRLFSGGQVRLRAALMQSAEWRWKSEVSEGSLQSEK